MIASDRQILAERLSPIVCELDGEVEIGGLDQRLNSLKIIPALAADAQLITLDLSATLFGPSSRISLETFFAFSWLMPSLVLAVIL